MVNDRDLLAIIRVREMRWFYFQAINTIKILDQH